jgi:hypothetical protein
LYWICIEAAPANHRRAWACGKLPGARASVELEWCIEGDAAIDALAQDASREQPARAHVSQPLAAAREPPFVRGETSSPVTDPATGAAAAIDRAGDPRSPPARARTPPWAGTAPPWAGSYTSVQQPHPLRVAAQFADDQRPRTTADSLGNSPETP